MTLTITHIGVATMLLEIGSLRLLSFRLRGMCERLGRRATGAV
jgi:hypothetical protein